jgi:hypothetical protein
MSATDPTKSYKIKDAIERIIWTLIAAAGGGLATVNIDFIPERWRPIAFLVFTAIANALTVLARNELSILPDPGKAVIEATATEVYKQIEVNGDTNLNVSAAVEAVQDKLSELGVDPAEAASIVLEALGSDPYEEEEGELVDGGDQGGDD